MAVSSIGVGSGLPLDELLTNIMAAESQPLTLMAKKEASYQAKLCLLYTSPSPRD